MRKYPKINFRRSVKPFLFLFSLSLWSMISFSQSPPVVGKVTSSIDNSNLSGVSVLVKGTTNGTTTDSEGNYSITPGAKNASLVFSYTGFLNKEVYIGSQTTIDLQLQASANNLNDVVVIGYGTQKKSDLTGSVGTVKSAELQERPAASINEALAGRIAGVQVNTNSGRPGGQTKIRIRGFISINSSNNPLYVIDGVYLPTGNQTQNSNSIDYINPNDIASI